MVISFDKLLHWLALYGCRSYYQMHVSGHATPADLRHIIGAANPNVLIPIHTRFPEMFVGWHDKVLAEITQGVPYVL
jgi:mRNA degradation ribonuclease J1/J2